MLYRLLWSKTEQQNNSADTKYSLTGWEPAHAHGSYVPSNRQKQIVFLINSLPQRFITLTAIIKNKLLTGLVAAQTAGIGLLLGTLSGAAIDYLNRNGVKNQQFITESGRQKHYRGAIEVLVYSKISQGTAYPSQPALRNKDSTKFLNPQQIKRKTFWNLCLLISDLGTFPKKQLLWKNPPLPKNIRKSELYQKGFWSRC